MSTPEIAPQVIIPVPQTEQPKPEQQTTEQATQQEDYPKPANRAEQIPANWELTIDPESEEPDGICAVNTITGRTLYGTREQFSAFLAS